MNEQTERTVKRMFWLAYLASRPVGMGHLHFSTTKTEDDVWAEVRETSRRRDAGGYFGDYLFGRMVKLRVQVKADEIEPDDRRADPEYQSWAGKYPTVDALRAAAVDSFGPAV